MRSLLGTLLVCLTIAVAFAAAPSSLDAQETTCEGCDHLQVECTTNPPGHIYAYCEIRGQGSEEYCHDWGDPILEACPEFFFVRADGLPVFDTNAVGDPTVQVAKGLLAVTECRGRLRDLIFSPAEGEKRRAQARTIVI